MTETKEFGFKRWTTKVDHCAYSVRELSTQRMRIPCGMKDFALTNARRNIRYSSLNTLIFKSLCNNILAYKKDQCNI